MISTAVERNGVSLILVLCVYAGCAPASSRRGRKEDESACETVRRRLVWSILLSLESPFAAGVMHRFVVEPTFTFIGTLDVIAPVRTFPGFALNVDLPGRWPCEWERSSTPWNSMSHEHSR